MKCFNIILPLVCLFSTFSPSYGMSDESKEVKTSLSSSSSSSSSSATAQVAESKETKAQSQPTATVAQNGWTQYVQQQQTQSVTDRIATVYETTERILQRFRIEPATVHVVIGKVNGGYVSCDATTRTFVIDDIIANSTFGFGDLDARTQRLLDLLIANTESGRRNLDRSTINQTAPALIFYVYWLVQFLRNGNNRTNNLLTVMRLTAQYLVDDGEFDAMIYGIISRLDLAVKGHRRAENYPTYEEEYALMRRLYISALSAKISESLGVSSEIASNMPSTQTNTQNNTIAPEESKSNSEQGIWAVIKKGFFIGLEKGLSSGSSQ